MHLSIENRLLMTLEYLREYRTYFPVFGDSPEVIEQKRKAREEATRAMQGMAGRAAPRGSNVIDWNDL